MGTGRETVATSARRFTVDDAIAMSEAGIIGDAERVKLVDGVLVQMSLEGWSHARVTGNVVGALVLAYRPRGFVVRSTSTLPLGAYAARQPGVCVAHDTHRWPVRMRPSWSSESPRPA
jgi:Uma2 family endonuclease